MSDLKDDGRWSVRRSRAWYEDQPWMVGCNFLPSTAINQVEMFQTESYDPVTIRRELGWARELGFNTLRVYLHDILWNEEVRPGFLKSFDHFLDICASLGLRCIVVFFDDCHWDHTIAAGPQHPRVSGVHNSGWLKSPGRKVIRAYQDGTISGRDGERLKSYLQGVLERHSSDPRIVMWDIYNEPLFPESKSLLEDAWTWARETPVSQPLTGCHYGSTKSYAVIQSGNADVLSYHCYDTKQQQVDIDFLAKEYQGRPVICTEYMCRPASTFENCLPILKQNKVGALSWGLVNGKSGTVWPWPSQDRMKEMVARPDWSMREIEETHGYDRPAPGDNYPEPERWFHDIFRVDGTPYAPDEVDLIRRLTGIADS